MTTNYEQVTDTAALTRCRWRHDHFQPQLVSALKAAPNACDAIVAATTDANVTACEEVNQSRGPFVSFVV